MLEVTTGGIALKGCSIRTAENHWITGSHTHEEWLTFWLFSLMDLGTQPVPGKGLWNIMKRWEAPHIEPASH